MIITNSYLKNKIKPLAMDIVGSSIIPGCLTAKDEDILMLVNDKEGPRVSNLLEGMGFTRESEEYDDTDFISYRLSTPGDALDKNVIVVYYATFYDNFVLASKLCRDLKLYRREDRVKVHKAILYGDLDD